MNLWASLYVVCQKLYLFMNSPTHKLGNRLKRERERERPASHTKKNDSHTWALENADLKSRKRKIAKLISDLACNPKPKRL